MKDISTNIKNFHYGYRFNDENYNLLSKDDIKKIIPLTKDESAKLWQKSIDMTSIHYKECISMRSRIKNISNNCGWGDNDKEEETRNMLKKMAEDHNEVIFFWSKHYSVKTVWKIFYQYWNDFCYPSDDGNLILYKDNILIYDEDRLYIINN